MGRLGMDPTRARAFVRLDRGLVLHEILARTYRSGALSWVKASVLPPLVSADSLGWFVEDWVAWAGRVTVRRLREDVEQALALSEVDPKAFRRGGGRPPEVCGDREIRAAPRGTGGPVARRRPGNLCGAEAHGEHVARRRPGNPCGAKTHGEHVTRDGREFGTGPRDTGEHAARDDREIGAGPRRTGKVDPVGVECVRSVLSKTDRADSFLLRGLYRNGSEEAQGVMP